MKPMMQLMLKLARVLLAGCAGAAAFWSGAHAANLSYHGGPIMQTARSVVIFWLPPGSHFVAPPQDNAAQDQLYEDTIQKFFTDLSGTAYLNVTTQYIGPCSGNTCSAPANPGGVSLATVIVDQTPYPNSPLQDGDVQNEIRNQIAQRGLGFDLNTEFFVYTGASVQECNGILGCTSTDFCAYHSEFDLNGGKVVYAFMPNVNSLPGCSEGVSAAGAPNQFAADQEVAVTSHELFESITDPEPMGTAINFLDPFGNTAWWDSDNLFSGTFGDEIGDKCNQIPAATALQGKAFIVQQQWSNDTAACVAAFGPSIRFDVNTGSDDLRGDSSSTVALLAPNQGTLQTLTLKAQNQGSWGNNSTHAVVTGLRPATIATGADPLGSFVLRLTSHNGTFETDDNWNVENLAVVVKDPGGNVQCSFAQGGDPLVRLTGSAPTDTFAMPCPPPVVTSAPFTTINFTIVTGSDDLRGDSSATADLRDPDGATLQTVTLKSQDQGGWGNNSTHTLSFGLDSPAGLAAFGSVVLRLTSHNGTFESDDNWNVQSANISLSGGSNPPSACLANVGGNPFARLTGSGPTVTIGAGSGC